MKWDEAGQFRQTRALHPASSLRETAPPVLIISNDKVTCRELERAMPPSIAARSVAAAAESEGLGTRVVLIGGSFPLAELVEVRAHPQLFDKPVVLFAPMRELPEMDWREMDVWPVVGGHNSLEMLVARVRQLLDATDPAHIFAEVTPLHVPPRDVSDPHRR